MIFKYSSQGVQFGRFPGGGIGCLLTMAVIGFVLYYALKGLYYFLWWATPALLVLALIINWRVFPDTIKNWLDTLESRPLSAIINAAIAVLAFPFFALWLFLKALGARNMEKMRREYSSDNTGAGTQEGEFTEFEELESTPMNETPEPEPLEKLRRNEPEPPKKEDNPYDRFFGQ